MSVRAATWGMCEAGEDILAEAIKSGVKFGLRCGCPECDEAAWGWLRKIYHAMEVERLKETRPISIKEAAEL